MWRSPGSLDTRMKSILSLPSLFPPYTSTTLRAFRTLFTHSNPSSSRLLQPPQSPPQLPLSKPHSLSLSLPQTRILRRDSNFSKPASSRVAGRFGFDSSFAVTRCISSLSPTTDTLEWNDGGFAEEDPNKPSIPVRAYFFSTR